VEYPTRTRQWTRAEYERLIGIGVFRPGEPIEILGGQLIVAEPQGSAHHTALRLVEDALRVVFGPGGLVRLLLSSLRLRLEFPAGKRRRREPHTVAGPGAFRHRPTNAERHRRCRGLAT
jgi:hypothetical protein